MSAAAAAVPAGSRTGANPWLIAFLVAGASFMEVLDTTIANVVLPYIAGGMGVSEDEASWVVTTYLVANAVILTASSYLAKRFGRKAFFLTCLVLFTVSSLMCGMAWSSRCDAAVPGASRLRGWWDGAGRAIDSGGFVSAAETRPGFRAVRCRGGGGARGRADARRLACRQCLLAVVLPDQRACWRACVGGDCGRVARATARRVGAGGSAAVGRVRWGRFRAGRNIPWCARGRLWTGGWRTTGSVRRSSSGRRWSVCLPLC